MITSRGNNQLDNKSRNRDIGLGMAYRDREQGSTHRMHVQHLLYAQHLFLAGNAFLRLACQILRIETERMTFAS
jgi:hypothetical protein